MTKGAIEVFAPLPHLEASLPGSRAERFMSRGIWRPSTLSSSVNDASDAPRDELIPDLRTEERGKGRLFAVVARPFNFFGRGVSATANGVSTVVQSPVRAARGLRREEAIPAIPVDHSPPAQPDTSAALPQEKARAAWDG